MESAAASDSPANNSPAAVPNATTPPAETTLIIERRKAHIDQLVNTALNSNTAAVLADPVVTQEVVQSFRHLLLALKEDDFYSKAAVVQAIAKSSLRLTPGPNHTSLLREAKGDDIRRTREQERTTAREEARQAREAREAAYQERQALREQRQAARQAAQQEARGHVGYVVQGGVTRIGRNYM